MKNKILTISVTALVTLLSQNAYPAVNDIVGVTVAPTVYQFDSSPTNPLDALNGGASKLQELGVKVTKVWFSVDSFRGNYPQNSTWEPSVTSLKQLAQTAHYTSLFQRPFSVYSLVASEADMPDWKINGLRKWANGIDTAEYNHIYTQFYDLTAYLYATYKNTGKTFILQNWEGDNALTGAIETGAVTSTAIQGMIQWTNAKQDAITAARNAAVALGYTGVKVYGAFEVNKIQNQSWPNKVIDNVVPSTYCDLYSYSNYETGGGAQKMTDALNALAAKAPDSAAFGNKNIFLGEMGAPENLSWGGSNDNQLAILKTQLDAALAWGVKYAIPWALYCTGVTGKTSAYVTWGMNEGVGTEVCDGNRTNEGVNYGATWTTGNGVQGAGLVFDGVNDYVLIADAPDLDASKAELGFYVRFKLNALPTGTNKYVLFNKTNSYRMDVDSAGKLSFLVGTTNNTMGGAGTTVKSTLSLAVDTWYEVLAFYDPTHVNSERLLMHLKPLGGTVSKSTTVTSISGSVVDSTGALNLGRAATGGSYFNGVLDRVSLYNTAFPDGTVAGEDDEVTWFYQGYPARNNSDFKGFWFRRFDGTYTYQWDYMYHVLPMTVQPASTLIDQLDNLSKVYSASSNITFATDNAALNCEGDPSRIKRSSTADGEVVYSLSGMFSFTAKLYYYGSSYAGKIKVYHSANGTTWTEITALSYLNNVSIPGGSWKRVYVEPTNDLPVGTAYIKIKLIDTVNAWNPQLSSVYISK
jgi:hypothetical protein